MFKPKDAFLNGKALPETTDIDIWAVRPLQGNGTKDESGIWVQISNHKNKMLTFLIPTTDALKMLAKAAEFTQVDFERLSEKKAPAWWEYD